MSPVWPAQAPVPPLAMPEHVGRAGALPLYRGESSEGSVAKSLSIEIVRVVFALFSDNARAFLQECQRAGASSPWATSVRGSRLTCGPPRGPRWAEISLVFL